MVQYAKPQETSTHRHDLAIPGYLCVVAIRNDESFVVTERCKYLDWVGGRPYSVIRLLLLVFFGFLVGCHEEMALPPPPGHTTTGYGDDGEPGKVQKPATSDTLPPFFPPKATLTADLRAPLKKIYSSYRRTQGKGPSMRQLDGDLSAVLEEGGYENLSHYWLEGKDNPGFAEATRIEFIDDLGQPVMDHRFETRLPTPNWFRGWDFLKALVLPRNGRYRLIAFVVAQKALVEKSNEMTRENVEAINHGPNALSGRDWADLEVTPDYNFTAYIYEFYRKSRSEPITMLPNTNIKASQHLAGIDFTKDLNERMRVLSRP